MNKRIRFVGLDVHKETLSVAVAASEGEAISLGTIPNDPDAIGKSIDGAFADWSDEYCKPDPGACDDFPNQQDTKGACIASNLAATSPSPANTGRSPRSRPWGR